MSSTDFHVIQWEENINTEGKEQKLEALIQAQQKFISKTVHESVSRLEKDPETSYVLCSP